MKDIYDFSSGKRGAVAPAKGKTRITIMLDDAVIEAARKRADEEGIGYQTLINRVLKESFLPTDTTAGPDKLNEILLALEALTQMQHSLAAKLDRSFENGLKAHR